MSDTDRAEEAFRHIYETHYGAVLAYCRRRSDAFTAQDATSEVFTIVWKKIDQHPDAGSLLPWLYGIAYRVIGHQWRGRDRYRKLKERLLQVPVDIEPGPEAAALARFGDRSLIAAVRRLRDTDQEILRLAAWEELSHAEIASALEISVSAAEQRFHRAKKRLAAEYDNVNGSSDNAVNDGGAT